MLCLGVTMKFESISVGDEVLIPVFLSIGWRDKRYFLIKAEVTKTTKTQFSVGTRRFKKDNGHEIGADSFYGAEHEGEYRTRWNVTIHEDQTLEFNALKAKVLTHRAIQELQDDIKKIHLDLSTNIEILDSVVNKLSISKKALEIAKGLNNG